MPSINAINVARALGSMLALPKADGPTAQLQPIDPNKQAQKRKEKTKQLGPSRGRTARLGRKVEKPAPAKTCGPSGPKDGGKHDRKRANK